MNNLIKHKKNIILTISFILFTILTLKVLNNKIEILDKNTEAFILNIRNNTLNNIMIFITNIGSSISLIIINLILLLTIKDKKIPISIFKNLSLSFILSQLIKIILKRPRPSGINLVLAKGFSYPSGHSMVSMAFFGYLAYLIYKNLKNKKIKVILITILLSLSILIGFSRIYLGVHYLSDVIGGFLLSTTYLMFYIQITHKSEVINK